MDDKKSETQPKQPISEGDKVAISRRLLEDGIDPATVEGMEVLHDETVPSPGIEPING